MTPPSPCLTGQSTVIVYPLIFLALFLLMSMCLLCTCVFLRVRTYIVCAHVCVKTRGLYGLLPQHPPC